SRTRRRPTALPEGRRAVRQPLFLLPRALPAESLVAVREATETGDDVTVQPGVPGIVLEQGAIFLGALPRQSFELLDRLLLDARVFGVLHRHKGEDARDPAEGGDDAGVQ